MAPIYSIFSLIVIFAIVGVALTHTETAQIITAGTNGFANALTAAKP